MKLVSSKEIYKCGLFGVTEDEAVDKTGWRIKRSVIRHRGSAVMMPVDEKKRIMLVRQYGNNEWTKTSGLDYDFNLRFPATSIGKFSLNVNGTYTARYDQVVVKGQDVQRQVGTTTSDISKTRASATFKWTTDLARAWVRFNHADPLASTICNSLTHYAKGTRSPCGSHCL